MFLGGNSTYFSSQFMTKNNFSLTNDEINKINTSSTATLYLGDKGHAVSPYKL